MKALLYSVLTLVLMAKLCNPQLRESTRIHFENKANYGVRFTFPGEQTSLYEDLDTTMTSYDMRVYDVGVVSHTSRIISSPADTFEDWIPKGREAFSMFVYNWDRNLDCYENDLYYVRYDLTLDDIYSLCDNDGVLHVSYPPSPEMKDIKMWPPYEEVIKNAEKN